MAKKFNYKLPSMVALTLFGTAFTAHQANAAEQPQNQSNHKNVLDDQTALKQQKKLKAKLHNQLQMYLVHKHIKTLPKFNLNTTHKVLHMMHH